MGIPVAFGGIALLLLGITHSPLLSIALLSCVALGVYSCLPVFFALPSEFLTGFSAAAGIALITSVANLGGFAGPYAVRFHFARAQAACTPVWLVQEFRCS
ncbi:MAG: transporter [Edaphobacter sp.]|nr:transporter [Edaphobacter sp.]